MRSRGSPGICRGGVWGLILMFVITFQQNQPWFKMEVCFRRSLLGGMVLTGMLVGNAHPTVCQAFLKLQGNTSRLLLRAKD